MADAGAGEKLKVFISYSRKDSAAFTDELLAGLELAPRLCDPGGCSSLVSIVRPGLHADARVPSCTPAMLAGGGRTSRSVEAGARHALSPPWGLRGGCH